MITVWLIRWTKKAAKENGITGNRIVPIDLTGDDRIKVRCPKTCHASKWHWGNSMGVFETRKEAVAWLKGNKAFEVVRANLLTSPAAGE